METRVDFRVDGLPPKKDGAKSMWLKPTEVARIKALRLAACAALDGRPPPNGSVSMTVRVFAPSGAGDLDNFVTGISDALMAVHPRASLDVLLWDDLPACARPHRAIAFIDDSVLARISIERFSVPPDGPRYEVELEWLEAER